MGKLISIAFFRMLRETVISAAMIHDQTIIESGNICILNFHLAL